MENRKYHKGLVTGLIIAFIGAIFLLRNVGLLDYSVTHYIISWKTLLVAIGIIAVSRGRYASGLFVGGLGVIFWLPEIFQYQFTLHQVFIPSVLIILGAVLLLKAAGLNKPKNPESEFVSYEEITTEQQEKRTV